MPAIRRFILFIKFVVKHFFENDGVYRAAALTFTSLLALVPLILVSLSIFSAFPVFEKLQGPMQDFIFSNFIPESGKVVQLYVQNFVNQASRLSVTGMSFLIITAILLLYTIEQAFNEIWRVPKRRPNLNALLLYWAILTLTPLFIALSVLASDYVLGLPGVADSTIGLWIRNLHFIVYVPFLFTVLAFTVLYIAVPNCKVRFLHALIAAMIAAFLLKFALYAFNLYLTQYKFYELLYGAFASVPIFFLWIYWVWVIILFGAEIAHAFAASYYHRSGDRIDPFSHSLCYLQLFWEAQQRGQDLSISQLIQADTHNYQIAPEEVVARLRQTEYIRVTQRGAYVLSRDLQQIDLAALYYDLGWALPSPDQIHYLKTPWRSNVQKLINALDDCRMSLLKTKIVNIFKG